MRIKNEKCIKDIYCLDKIIICMKMFIKMFDFSIATISFLLFSSFNVVVFRSLEMHSAKLFSGQIQGE